VVLCLEGCPYANDHLAWSSRHAVGWQLLLRHALPERPPARHAERAVVAMAEVQATSVLPGELPHDMTGAQQGSETGRVCVCVCVCVAHAHPLPTPLGRRWRPGKAAFGPRRWTCGTHRSSASESLACRSVPPRVASTPSSAARSPMDQGSSSATSAMILGSGCGVDGALLSPHPECSGWANLKIERHCAITNIHRHLSPTRSAPSSPTPSSRAMAAVRAVGSAWYPIFLEILTLLAAVIQATVWTSTRQEMPTPSRWWRPGGGSRGTWNCGSPLPRAWSP
jgi:hypothetical protein